MYKIISLISFCILTLMVITSCSDKSTNPTTTKTYFPLKTGSWWTYENYSLDNTGKRKTETIYIDSIAVTGSTLKLEKNATVLTSFEKGVKTEDNYFYSDGQKYYAHSSFVQPDLSKTSFNFPINLDDQWLVIADFNSTEWSLTTKQISNADFPVPGLGTAKINGTLTIKGQMGTTKVMTIEGVINNATANEFKLIYSFSGKISIGILPFDLKFTVYAHNWYVENIGLVQSVTDPLKISIPNIYSVDIDGTEAYLLKANIIPN